MTTKNKKKNTHSAMRNVDLSYISKMKKIRAMRETLPNQLSTLYIENKKLK